MVGIYEVFDTPLQDVLLLEMNRPDKGLRFARRVDPPSQKAAPAEDLGGAPSGVRCWLECQVQSSRERVTRLAPAGSTPESASDGSVPA
jgi:hypothetical protein